MARKTNFTSLDRSVQFFLDRITMSRIPWDRPPCGGKRDLVLVTAPHSSDRTNEEGLSVVEPVRWKTIQLENRFGADDVGPNEKELEERPLSIVPDKTNDAPAGFDVCREYGYKYEYTQDYPEDDSDDQIPDQTKSELQSLHPLDKKTAIITKTNEHLPYIHILGKTYHPVHTYHERKSFEKSLFWFTYRCDFPQISPYGIDTDAGWGCMLRSAQMLLAHTLRIHFKTKNWMPPSSFEAERRDEFVRKLLTWFADFPSKFEAVYSLHNMVAAGYAKYQVLPGEWWGPGTACYVIRDLVELHNQSQPSLFRVHVSSEGTVYRDAVYELMTRESKQRAEERKRQKAASLPSPLHPLDPSGPSLDSIDPKTLDWDTSLLLLVPLRLGLDKFNDEYVDAVAKSFWLPQSVGILGGRPRGARWFYGAYADGSKVLGLDPHTVQSAPKRNAIQKVQMSDDYLQSVHTNYPDIYQINRMDPSLAIGFYCSDKKDFAALEAAMMELKRSTKSPDLFTFEEKTPNYLSSAMNSMMQECADFDDGARKEDDSDDEDYVLL